MFWMDVKSFCEIRIKQRDHVITTIIAFCVCVKVCVCMRVRVCVDSNINLCYGTIRNFGLGL